MFFGPWGTLNTDADSYEFLTAVVNGLHKNTVSRLVELYPDGRKLGCPSITGLERCAENGE
ncbi:hypothetical protein GGI42DRAFT_330792 [Trichoderma sp. SZMC 28013]